MNDAIILGAITFIAGAIAVVSPIIKLNTNIVKLNTTMEIFEKNYQETQLKLNNRVDYHGRQIDAIEKKQVNHEARLRNLEDDG